MLGDVLGVLHEQLALRDVEEAGLHLDAVRGDERLGLGESGGVDVADREVGAAAGELDGQRPADAGGGSGDDGDLVGEVGGHDAILDSRYRRYLRGGYTVDRSGLKTPCVEA